MPTGKFEKSFKFPFIENIDKVIHVIMFLILGGLIKFSYPKANTFLLFIALSIYGLSIEFLQDWLPTGRSFEVNDWLADIFGVIFGFLIYKWIKLEFLNKLKV